jgi:peptide chain release factor 2
VVTCQNERSQLKNRERAMKVLRGKLMEKRLEEEEAKARALKGAHITADWGNQIRSYVLHPYKQVKDHRTQVEIKNPDSVLDGDLDAFTEGYLEWMQKQA